MARVRRGKSNASTSLSGPHSSSRRSKIVVLLRRKSKEEAMKTLTATVKDEETNSEEDSEDESAQEEEEEHSCMPPGFKGFKDAHFYVNEEWEHFRWQFGPATRDINFEIDFVLTDEHIDDIIGLGETVCHNLRSLSCVYEGEESYFTNNASGLTDKKITAFAKACPNLTKVQLQGASNLGDKALIAFFKYCPDLESLEVTATGSDAEYTHAAFNALREHSSWAPKLKQLLVQDPSDDYYYRAYHKSVRALSRARSPQLVIKLVRVFELENRWGDSQPKRIEKTILKGRECDMLFPPSYRESEARSWVSWE